MVDVWLAGGSIEIWVKAEFLTATLTFIFNNTASGIFRAVVKNPI
jgi:hypothetical protein